MPTPPDRIRTVDGQWQEEITNSNIENITSKNSLSGKGCCPGKVRGQVKVIFDPKNESLEGNNQILVAERTDPGWITVIAQAKAIIVEYGSLLSHTAIVARELGIPTIVAASGVTKVLQSGDLIEMDGATGEIYTIQQVQKAQDTNEVA